MGDGTTSVTVLAAELLRVSSNGAAVSRRLALLLHHRCFPAQEAELLIAKKIHPQTIISGWRKATQVAREALREAAMDHRSVRHLPQLPGCL